MVVLDSSAVSICRYLVQHWATPIITTCSLRYVHVLVPSIPYVFVRLQRRQSFLHHSALEQLDDLTVGPGDEASRGWHNLRYPCVGGATYGEVWFQHGRQLGEDGDSQEAETLTVSCLVSLYNSFTLSAYFRWWQERLKQKQAYEGQQ